MVYRHSCLFVAALSLLCSVSSHESNINNGRLQSRSAAASAEDEYEEAKRIIMHPEDALAAEVLRLRSELDNTTKTLNSMLSQFSNLEKKIQTLEQNQLNTAQGQLERRRNDGISRAHVAAVTGDVYVRWGRNICPLDAEMIYKGYIAGKHYNEHGSGTDNLCLPFDPTWGNYEDGFQGYKGRIYGTEIDAVEPNHIIPYSVNEQDIPCAVCKSKRASTMMIPARTNCYPGWTLEYTGYIMTASSTISYSYNHICLDSQPEFNPHGGTNDNQHILYFTEAACGSLPCPPYVDGRELACVVCSK